MLCVSAKISFMKVIHIAFDERLLEKLDGDGKVKQAGRSVVIHRAVADYLDRKRRATIPDVSR